MSSTKGKLTVTESRKNGKTKRETHEESVSESVDPPVKARGGPMATVKYANGITINMGDFNSQRIDVGIELPSPVGAISKTWDFAEKMVEKRLQKKVDEALAEKDG